MVGAQRTRDCAGDLGGAGSERVVSDADIGQSEGALHIILERRNLHIPRADEVACDLSVARLPTYTVPVKSIKHSVLSSS